MPAFHHRNLIQGEKGERREGEGKERGGKGVIPEAAGHQVPPKP